MSFVLLLLPVMARADVVVGRVIDAETKEPLMGVNVKASLKLASTSSGMSMLFHYATTDSLGNFRMRTAAEGKLQIEFSLIGFKPSRKVDYSFSGNNTDTIKLGTIALTPTAIMLKEAQVSARMPRFTMKGDTIVFHPEAFKLEAGARLDELIRKLPGVETRSDGLYWNGKPLRMMVNGKDMLAGGHDQPTASRSGTEPEALQPEIGSCAPFRS